MFYLFELAYKFGLTNVVNNCEVGDFYDLIQIIAKEPDEAKKTIYQAAGINKTISEIKLLKITPITSPFITHSTNISDRIYNQFECIEKNDLRGK